MVCANKQQVVHRVETPVCVVYVYALRTMSRISEKAKLKVKVQARGTTEVAAIINRRGAQLDTTTNPMPSHPSPRGLICLISSSSSSSSA